MPENLQPLIDDILSSRPYRGLDLPVRVQTTEKQEGNQIIASFSNIKVNPGLVASQLNLPELDYAINTNPLRDAKPDNKETSQEAPNQK